mgnify:CR=1 FL=1|tara:strand:- start:1024 stop:1365 length:342 start_codon:yes stop_codon:yes gene_type:complete
MVKMKNIIIINFTDQILSINSQIQIDEYKNFEKLKITNQQACFIIVNSLSDIPDTKYAAKIIDETSITFYLITINMEPELIEKSLLTKSVKAVISGLGQKNLITKLNELINMV